MAMHIETQDSLLNILRQQKIISTAECQAIEKNAMRFQQTVFQHILQHKIVDPEKMATACATYFQNDVITTAYEHIVFTSLSDTFIKNNFIAPLSISAAHCVIAIANPEDRKKVVALSFELKLPVKITWLRYDFLLQHHNYYCSHCIYQSEKSQTKIIAEQILSDAIHQMASDIHLEPYHAFLRIRFRLDGLLQTITTLPIALSDGILSCLKVLSGLDIAIKRMPQDGRFSFRSYLGFYKNCRVSTCPTTYGEKIVIRLLNHDKDAKNISDLGLSLAQETMIKNTLQKPQGLILVTGPTGSGKTITLYTLLNMLNNTYPMHTSLLRQ